MSSNIPDVLSVAQSALQSFLQTLLGNASSLTLKTPEEPDVAAVVMECEAQLAIIGQANGRTVFVVSLDEHWLPLLSQAMLGEAMTVTDEGADDLVRELAAQGYGAVRNALSNEGIMLPEVTYLVSLPASSLDDEHYPDTLLQTPFDLPLDDQTLQGFALTNIPAEPSEAEAEDQPAAKAPQPAEQKSGSVPVAQAAFPDLGGEQFRADPNNPNFNLLAEVELEITVELGRRQLPLSDVLNLTNGSVIELDKLVGEPLQIFANGRLIAEGEAVVIDEQFGVRVTALASTRQRAKVFL